MTGGTSGLDDLDELYESIILDHYRNPRHTEPLEHPDVDVEANNPFCGDEIHIQLELDGDTVTGVSVSGRGCAISQSSASLLSEMLEDKNAADALEFVTLVRRMMRGDTLTEEEKDILGDVAALEGVKRFPVRIKCALLSWTALEDSLVNRAGT
ncbi:MAG: SUF system NifU family Fe-S cluster assembly protein [Chloroflexi bacterium]|nr:SUF system NifU family Fe-S cluster assembly protein [Chloroflexota bacterium]